jgi:hypothetical protein
MVIGEVPCGSENSFWQKWRLLGRADSTENSHFLSKTGKIRIYRAVWEPRKSRKGQLFFSATDFAVTSFNKVVFGGIRIGSSPVESWCCLVGLRNSILFRLHNGPLKLNKLLGFGLLDDLSCMIQIYTRQCFPLIVFLQIRGFFSSN